MKNTPQKRTARRSSRPPRGARKSKPGATGADAERNLSEAQQATADSDNSLARFRAALRAAAAEPGTSPALRELLLGLAAGEGTCRVGGVS